MAIKSICEPKMIVAKKLVARLRRDCIPRKRGKIKENATHFGWRQIAAPTGTIGESARKTVGFCVEKPTLRVC